MNHAIGSIPHRLAAVQGVHSGRLQRIEEDGTLIVAREHPNGPACSCDILLQAGELSPVLNPGERVLFVPPDQPGGRGCVLGAIGKYSVAPPQTDSRERVLRLAADEEISLTCGEASITLLANGAVLIRGVKVVSRAKGLNRIKGAAVQIN